MKTEVIEEGILDKASDGIKTTKIDDFEVENIN